VLCSTILCSAVLYCALQYYTVLCSTILCSAVLYCALQYHTVLCSTLLNLISANYSAIFDSVPAWTLNEQCNNSQIIIRSNSHSPSFDTGDDGRNCVGGMGGGTDRGALIRIDPLRSFLWGGVSVTCSYAYSESYVR
jgi:hypothetical protein